ncbi:MAG: hypothetical protein ACI32B_01755 [Erysipelotrichaceae bacterium]
MNKKNIAVIILTLIAAAIIIGLWVSNTIAIFDAMIYLAVLGVAIYFILIAINYKHSIYGGRFKEHYDGKEKDEEQ